MDAKPTDTGADCLYAPTDPYFFGVPLISEYEIYAWICCPSPLSFHTYLYGESHLWYLNHCDYVTMVGPQPQHLGTKESDQHGNKNSTQ
jgi:hypothetical protein